MKPVVTMRLLAAMSACLIAGCVAPCATSGGLPVDFALTFVVRSDNQTPGTSDRNAVYVLEPDRSLRIAYGPGASVDFFPPMHSRLTPDQVAALYTHIQLRKLQVEPTSPRAEVLLRQEDSSVTPGTGQSPGGRGPFSTVLYEVHITACAETHRFATTPDESPPTRMLLSLMIQMADGPSSP